MTEETKQSSKCLHRYLARVQIEFTTPFHVGSGAEWNESDAGIVQDPNGLPAIPGSSIAGVLRSALDEEQRRESRGKQRSNAGVLRSALDESAVVDSLFGYNKPAYEKGKDRGEGQGSRLSVSWAAIHDSKNIPVCGAVASDRLNDPVLRAALKPTLRDHVRINHAGAAADQGKFDELVVHAGHRFTFEVELIGDNSDKGHWEKLLELLKDPLVRFGGKTRRGLGSFKVVAVSQRVFQLTDAKDWGDWLLQDPDLGQAVQGTDFIKPQQTAGEAAETIEFNPEFFWMFGGGDDPDADMAPVRDTVIRWDADKGSARAGQLYIPGSSVKGALRHRMLFHACAVVGCYADSFDEAKFEEAQKLVTELFGEELDDRDKDRNTACSPGRIFIDDVFLPGSVTNSPDLDGHLPEPHLQHHVSIDRFTGGARDSMLFNEKPLFAGDAIQIPVWVKGDLSEKAGTAWKRTIDDLKAGRMALGGGAGRGLGFSKPATEVARA